MGLNWAEHTVEIDAPIEVCFDAIADYESFPGWQGAVQSVEVLDRHPDGMGRTVHLFLSAAGQKVDYQLDYSYDRPVAIRWDFVQGNGVKDVDGDYAFEDLGGDRTRATYRLGVQPSLPVPGIVAKRIHKQALKRSVEELKAEAERRHREGEPLAAARPEAAQAAAPAEAERETPPAAPPRATEPEAPPAPAPGPAPDDIQREAPPAPAIQPEAPPAPAETEAAAPPATEPEPTQPAATAENAGRGGERQKRAEREPAEHGGAADADALRDAAGSALASGLSAADTAVTTGRRVAGAAAEAGREAAGRAAGAGLGAAGEAAERGMGLAGSVLRRARRLLGGPGRG